jgi:hypothetical protein
MLSTNPYDHDLSREPHWAAKLNTNGNVQIVYMLAYYHDNGTEDLCPFFPWPDSCLPHAGDSEYIGVEIGFEESVSHWAVETVYLTAHFGATGDDSETVPFFDVEYAAKTGGYPRVFVSVDKHANYRNRQTCNGGALAMSDDCTNNQDTGRVFVGGYRNVGSNVVKLIDQTTSPRAGYTGVEYFWSGTNFCGWQPATRCADTPYRQALDRWDF